MVELEVGVRTTNDNVLRASLKHHENDSIGLKLTRITFGIAGFYFSISSQAELFLPQTSDFPVLDPSWTAQEEMALLEAVMDCGFGNW